MATGSSSPDLTKGVKESAVGRLVHRQMWPLSNTEIASDKRWGEVCQNIGRLMIYGSYPAAFIDPDRAEEILRNYCDGVLYKDLFALSRGCQNEKFMHLVKLLAYNFRSDEPDIIRAREILPENTSIVYGDPGYVGMSKRDDFPP